MDIKTYDIKIKKLLAKFSQQSYVITDNYHIEKFLSHIVMLNNRDVYTVCALWVEQMFIEEVVFVDSVSLSMKSFIFRLVSVLANDDMTFAVFRYKRIFNKVADYMILSSSPDNSNPSLILGFLKVLHVMSRNSKSMNWFLENKIWKYALKIYLENKTIYIANAAVEFIVMFVWNLNDNSDEKNCTMVLEELIQPLCDHPWKDSKVINSDQDEKMDRFLTPTISLLTDIISVPKYFGKGTIVSRCLHSGSSIEWFTWNVFMICHSENLMLNLAKLFFVSSFSRVSMLKQEGEEMNDDDMIKCNLVYFNLLNFLITKRAVDVILDFNVFCHRYLNNVCSLLSTESENYKHLESIRKQFIVLPIVSILITIKNPVQYDQEIVQLFVCKVFSIANEQGTRIAYSFRDLVKDIGIGDIVAVNAVQKLISMKDTVTVSQANIIFQALFYRLNNFDILNRDSECDGILSHENVEPFESMKLLSLIMDCLYFMMEKHEICWHESVEVIDVNKITGNILRRRDLSASIVSKAFRLIKMTISKFLTPSLILLLVDMNNSNMNAKAFRSVLRSKLYDHNWEVRDTILELLLVCIKISTVEYPPLQDKLLEENFTPEIVTISLNDSESYVRASALRCLIEIAKNQVLWEECLSVHPELHVRILKMLHDETEGIVRKEAVALLNIVYVHQTIPDNLNDYLLHSMVHAAVDDFYWEVQLEALQFWKTFINRLLTNQGMVDGKFLSVMFSKENRKIVTLDNVEITKRLKKIMIELSRIGCLGVLTSCLSDDMDVKLLEFTYSIAKELKALLDQYKIQFDEYTDVKMEFSSTEIPSTTCIKLEVDTLTTSLIDNEKSDSVIESILNADDINLLANVYQDHLNIKNEIDNDSTSNVDFTVSTSKVTTVNPRVFMEMLNNTKYEKLIEAKKSWLSGVISFNSLLDDMLGEYNTSDGNVMDCY